jgi:hypothetical protein
VSRKVHDRVDSPERGLKLAYIADAGVNNIHALRQLAMPGGEIVIYANFMAATSQHANRVAPDVSGAPRDENSHQESIGASAHSECRRSLGEVSYLEAAGSLVSPAFFFAVLHG